MPGTVIVGRVLKWGNSFGIRLSRKDLEAAGLKPGHEAIVRVEGKTSRIDLSDLPTFGGGRPDDSERHDELLGEARSKAPRRRKGRR